MRETDSRIRILRFSNGKDSKGNHRANGRWQD